jgi:far upstream element-binding protein
MADVDAAPPPPEVVLEGQPPAVESASVDQEVPAAGELDLKRKLEEVEPGTEANGDGEDAKRPRVDGEPDGAGEYLAHFAYPSAKLGL